MRVNDVILFIPTHTFAEGFEYYGVLKRVVGKKAYCEFMSASAGDLTTNNRTDGSTYLRLEEDEAKGVVLPKEFLYA